MEGRSDEHARRAARAARAAAGLAPADAAVLLEEAMAACGPLPCLSTPLADALEALGHDEALIAHCRRVLESGCDARERPLWQLRLAEACERRGDVAAAVTAHRAVLDASPRERRSLRALQRLHRREGDAAALVRALESELALCAGADEISLRLELAGILAGSPERGADALLHLRRVLDLEPARDAVLEHALSLAESLHAAGDQVALLDLALARATTPAARAGLLARQASLLAGPLANPIQAVSRWQEAIAVEPGLSAVLEPLRCTLERLGDWPALLDCILEEARAASPEVRRTLLERGAALAAEHFGADAALPWLARMRADAPDDTTLLDRVAALHRCAGRREALRDTLDELASRPISAEHAAAVARERVCLGRATSLGVGTPPLSERAPSPPPPAGPRRPPEDAGAHGALAGPDPAREAREAETELEGLDPDAAVYTERRRFLSHRLARLYAGPLRDPERALPFLRVAAAAPPSGFAVTGLESERSWAEDRLLDLLREEGSFVELESRLAARLARAPGAPEAWLELAALREERLFAPAAAADAYREALQHGADVRLALGGLRRASRALGDWSEVARTLEAEIDAAPSSRERAALLRELGDVAWHHLGATTRASRAFAGALEADPRDLVSLRSLRALLASMEDWRGALDLVESEIELLAPGDGAGRRARWIEAAEIAAERVDDPERAIRALDAADALAPLAPAERRRLAALLHRCGALARYVAVAVPLLEDGAGADADEWLRLGHACLALGRLDVARTHAKRAVVAGPERDAAWELLAEVELAQGRRSEAAESLLRAADASGPARGVARLLRAATIVAPLDPEFAHGLREAACARDPGSVRAWFERARSAAGLGRNGESEEATVRAVELAVASPGGIDRDPLLAGALETACAARHAGRATRGARILTALHALAPENVDVLREQTLALRETGDIDAALRAAETLLDLDPGAIKEPRVGVALAEGLAAAGRLEEAAERFAEATIAEPALESAWAGLTQSLERSGRTDEAVEALDTWARVAEPERRARCRLRAAELVFRSGDRSPSAETRLRDLLREEPGCIRGAELLALQLLERGRVQEACDVLESCGRHAAPEAGRADLERLRARALAELGRIEEAGDAWARVLAEDPTAADAAHARAALQRVRGAWQEAAETLESFLEGAGHLDPEVAARTWRDVAALRAGPLRDPPRAVDALREAVRACPAQRAAREALADALSRQGPDDGARDEAVLRHLELLEDTPERVESIRALVAIAEERRQSAAAEDGRALLRALGASEGPARVGFRTATSGLENTVWERARRLAQTLARELSRALGASRTLEPPPAGEGIEAFRLAAIVAEAELSAAALVPLGDEEAHAVIATAAVLAAERPVVSGDGRLVNALAGALGRRARRRAREALAETAPEEIAEIDPVAWRLALRALSHAVALDAGGGDLRSALRALLDDGEGSRTPDGDGDLPSRIAAHAVARELLRRVVLAWGRTLRRASEPR